MARGLVASLGSTVEWQNSKCRAERSKVKKKAVKVVDCRYRSSSSRLEREGAANIYSFVESTPFPVSHRPFVVDASLQGADILLECVKD